MQGPDEVPQSPVESSPDVVEAQSSVVESAVPHHSPFEDVSDADDDPPQTATPVSLFVSTSTTERVHPWTWPCIVSNGCSNSPPVSATASYDLFPVSHAAPAVPSSSSPRVDDMMPAMVMLPTPMKPLTIDTSVEPSRCQEVDEASKSTAEVIDEVQQQGDDIMDTSQMTSEVTEQPLSTTSLLLTDASPSPPKIPRLRIIMGAGDASQLTTSPGSSSASVPYVVTVDDALADVTATSQPSHDVDESLSSSLADSVSRQQRKMKSNSVVKVRSVKPPVSDPMVKQ